MELHLEKLTIPEGANLILGQSHFIKTVEDLYEILVAAAPGIKFGLAFSEASGDCLIRVEGNDADLTAAATDNAQRLAAGHTFNILMKERLPHQRAQRHQTLPRGLPDLLRHRQPRGSHPGPDRTGPGHPGGSGRPLPQRRGRQQRPGLALRNLAAVWL